MITKTKRNDIEQPLFENPVAQMFEDVDNENGKQVDPADEKYDALSKQLADLQMRLSESEKANMALMTTPSQWRSQTNEAPVEIKPESVALPDPALDPDGFDRAQGERQRIRYENQKRRDDFENRQKNNVQEKIDDLWFEFGERYPAMASDKERIDFVSTQVAKQAHKRGMDVERYMFLTRDKFIEDVAAKYEEVFGAPEEDDNESNEVPSRSRRAEARPRNRSRSNNRNRQEDEYVGRTAGVFGGAESGGRPTRGREEEDTGPSMIDDIQALQRKTGFF